MSQRKQSLGRMVLVVCIACAFACEDSKSVGKNLAGATINNKTSAKTPNKTPAETSAQPAQKDASGKAPKVTKNQGASRTPPTLASSAKPTAMTWQGSVLWVGYDDGKVVKWPLGQSPKMLKSQVKVPVKTIASTGHLAILGASTPTLYDLEHERALMTFSQIKDFGGAAFSPDGKKLFLTSRAGKVIVWKDIESLRQRKQGRLEEYLAKQQGDFAVSLGKLAGHVVADTRDGLIIERADGVLIYWQMSKPNESLEVLYHKPPLKALAVQNGHLMVTNAQHQLRVSNIQQRNMLRWSVREAGDHIGAGSIGLKTFASIKDNTLSVRNLNDGKVVWKKPVAQGDRCGLIGSPDGKWLAQCVNNRITVHQLQDGKPRHGLWRVGDDGVKTSTM